MRFTKMHGAGNDYVYIDAFREPLATDASQLAPAISDRHFGVGGDGLVVIAPSERADARMRMYNADGTESEMCGNAVRCVAKYVYDHGLARKPQLTIETGRGVLSLDLEVRDNRVQRVTVDMAEPILAADKIPTTLTGDKVVDVPVQGLLDLQDDGWVQAAGLDPRMTCVSMGNPHAVLYCADVAKVPLERIGKTLEHAAVFPRRMNIHFVQIQMLEEVSMRTWERGSGITLACGTGASAVCVAGVLSGRSGRRILAHLPGGDLELHWAENGHVYMTGPAVEVFSGEWNR
ncbi:MAG: diaminopimelate epimerase [Planctomycetaceae bacterium]|nr:diaminopimelate epimerase [Planctomycetaceae bacterium]